MNSEQPIRKKLDKALYRWAYQQYQEWNEAKTAAPQNAHLSSTELFRRYAALVEFCWKLAPPQSEQQRQQRLVDWDNYYARIQQFEARRKAGDRTT